MDLIVGNHVTPNIRLKRPLGQGGMASVWVADHLSLDIEVAVKFIATELIGSSPELVARFNREAGAIAKIRSPHVVQVLDHGLTADGTPYIVMELLEGEDLGARLDRDGRMPMAQVVTLVAQVAKALTRAHATGIIHRDIKPDNIFIVHSDDDEDLFVKLLDFGIAKHTQKKSRSVVTTTGTMVGTPAYMSPEQILSGKHVDERADLWSLGVVAYHALTGEVPFEGTTLGALCVAISRGVYQAPSYLEARLPSAIDAWMTRALAPVPEGRFQSPKELADALRDAAESGPLAGDDIEPFSRPSAEFLISPEGRQEAAWEDAHSARGVPSSGRSRVPRGLVAESVLVVPTKRFLSPVYMVGGGALLVGILAAAAFTRVGGEAALPSQSASGRSLLVGAADQSSLPARLSAMPGGVAAPSSMAKTIEPSEPPAASATAHVEAPAPHDASARATKTTWPDPKTPAKARPVSEAVLPRVPSGNSRKEPVPAVVAPAIQTDRGF